MSRLFTRLAARARNEEHSVAPRVRGLFEPATPAQQDLIEETNEVQRASAQVPHRDPPRHMPATPFAAHDDKGELPQPTSADPAQQGPRDAAQVRRSCADQAPPTPQEPAERATLTEHRVKHTETLRERVVEKPVWFRHEAPDWETQPAQQPQAPSTRLVDAPVAAPVRAAHDPGVRLDPPVPVAPLPAPQHIAPLFDIAVPSAQELQAIPPTGRTVHIHVDRIEVRSMTRPTATKATPRRSANPAPRLEEYLRGNKS